MTALLLVALLQAAGGNPLPEVTASVDRARLRAGEELTLTVHASTRSLQPLGLTLPLLSGFAVVGSRDVTEVSISGAGGGGPVRTTLRELRLRAERPGTLVIGPVRAGQDGAAVDTDPITITVDSAASATAALLSPLALALIETAAPPRRADQVALTIIVPDDTVVVGQQLDVIAAVWMPRELRQRLRRQPVLTLPTPDGVWAYPPAAPTGVAAARRVDGHWMDLFVAHQVVFPLQRGRIVIPPASVQYAVAVTFSFFSREERYSLQSDSVAITVLPLPAAPRAADDRGVVGRSITLDLRIDPGETRVGEPIDVVATVSGVGNVQLWPEPEFRWPLGFRAYAARTEVRVAPQDGLIAGRKSFRFLVVPDSAGSAVLAEVRYPYYDIGAGAWTAARAAPRAIPVAVGAEPRAARALPPLLAATEPSWADRMGRGLGTGGWAAILIVPPLGAWLARRRRHRVASEPAADARTRTRLGGLERAFHAVLTSHVPDAFARDGDGLAQALRAAGVESAVADHVMRLRDRLRAARYGPRGLGDAVELAAEIEQVLRVLGGGSGGGSEAGSRRRRVTAALTALLVAGAGGGEGGRLAAQASSAEALYQAGALRAAADSFAARATAAPFVAAHWYDLGATLYRAGADGKASAAWTVAARRAPRDRVIRRARRLLPPPDVASDALLAVGPATPHEWALVAAVGWAALWGAVAARRRRVTLIVLGLATGAAALAGTAEWRRRARAVAIVVVPATPVRVAPYGSASAAGSVDAGAALVVARRYGAWLEVRRDDGVRGWVLASEVVPL